MARDRGCRYEVKNHSGYVALNEEPEAACFFFSARVSRSPNLQLRPKPVGNMQLESSITIGEHRVKLRVHERTRDGLSCEPVLHNPAHHDLVGLLGLGATVQRGVREKDSSRDDSHS